MASGSLRDKPLANGDGRPQIVAEYNYTDESGRLLYQVVRFEPKDFRQRRPDGRGWTWGLGDVRRVLYRLPDLARAPRDRLVIVVEGEKDADHLAALELLATTNPMGAGKWRSEYNETLRGRHVFILPDNDEPGRKHAEQVAQALQGVASSVAILELPGLPPKGDVSDWLAAGGSKDELLRLLKIPKSCGPPRQPEPPAAEAYHGLAGDIVRAIEPHSEADPVALLAETLVAFGNAIGRTAHFRVEGNDHHLNEFLVLIGRTSKARKGTSWGRVRPLLDSVAPDWARDRIQGGASSGEGIIWAVRDAITERQAIKKDGRVIDHQEVETDTGVSDKRLLLYEPEFASVLKVIERQGNTLSTLVRQAWDCGDLRTLTKNSPARATGAHISIIGHITSEELRRRLSETESANGFGNRFLWLYVDRSKALPLGGNLCPQDLEPLERRLRDAVAFAGEVREMTLDNNAREVWCAVYEQLSEGQPGLAGALISRAEAHVLRLACLYALLDESATVRDCHLAAALALWDYCHRSVVWVFGDSLGDPVADDILALLRQAGDAGVSRTEIREHFSRHRSSAEIGRALGLLHENKLARWDKKETGGRPEERWYATKNGSR